MALRTAFNSEGKGNPEKLWHQGGFLSGPHTPSYFGFLSLLGGTHLHVLLSCCLFSNPTARREELCHGPVCWPGDQLNLCGNVLAFVSLHIDIVFICVKFYFSSMKLPFPFSWGPHLSAL